jgi:hypothetical protein
MLAPGKVGTLGADDTVPKEFQRDHVSVRVVSLKG